MSLPRMARIANRAISLVSGSHSTEFLNGNLASSIRLSHTGQPFFSAMLNAQGRVLYDLLIYPYSLPNGQPGYLIEHDSRPSETPFLLTLKRFILRSKVKIRDMTDEFDVWALWDASIKQPHIHRTWNRVASGAAEPSWPENQWPWTSKLDSPSLCDMRAPHMGFRSLVKKGDRPSQASDHDDVPFLQYLEHRISRGVPEGFTDIPPMQAFPMESNLDLMGGIDFRKGCYVGQELTVRTYHTGMVRKRICPVTLHNINDGQILDDGLDIKPVVVPGSDAPRPRGSGKLLSNVNGIGLALLRLEQIEGMKQGRLKFQISTPSGQQVQVIPSLPDWWPSNEIQI